MAHRDERDIDGGFGRGHQGTQDFGIYGANHWISPTAHLFASPSPVGLYLFGLATAIAAAHNIGWVDESANFVAFTFCLWSGGVIPFIVAIWEIVRNNLFAAVTFFVFSSFFLSYCTFGLLLAAGSLRPLSVAVLPLKGLQYALLIYAIISVLFILLSLKMNVALTCVFTSICMTFFLLAAGLTRGDDILKAGGYFSILVGISTWYLATAELLVDLSGKAILPVGWYPWAGQAKMHAAMTSKRRMNPHTTHAAPIGTKGAAVPSNAAGNGASMV